MPWLVYSSLDGAPTNLVDGTEPDVRATVGYAPMKDGRDGACFGTTAGGSADNNARLRYTIAPPANGAGLENGLVVMRYQATRDFNFTTDNLQYALWGLGVGEDAAATNDFLLASWNYNTTTKTGLEYIIKAASPLATYTGQLVEFALATGDEIHLAFVWQNDPEDPTGNPNFRIYINGRCVLNYGNRTLAQYPAEFNRFFVGNLNAVGARPCQGRIQDVGLALGERFSDADILAMANGTYDFPSLPKPTKMLRPMATQETLAHAVVHLDREAGRLWGFDTATFRSLAYTDDLTGLSGWTTVYTAASGKQIRDITTTPTHVLFGIEGSLLRAAKSDLSTWTTAVVLDGAGGDNFPVPGWGLTSQGSNVVVAEYRTPTTASGMRVLHSSDHGANWTTRFTLGASGSTTNMHIHGVEYCPFTGELWLTTGDFTDRIGYSTDHGANWTWLNGDADHSYQALNFSFSPEYVVTGIDRAGIDHCSNLLCYLRQGKKYQPWIGAAETGGRSWDANMFYASHGGSKYHASGWSLQRMDDGRWIVYCDNEGSGGSSYLMLLNAELTQQVRLFDFGVTQVTRGSAVVTLGTTVFVGNRRFVIGDDVARQTLAQINTDPTQIALQQKVGLIGTGTVNLRSAVDPVGQIKDPIVIGDDYLATHSNAFVWNVDPLPGVSVGDASCKFGGEGPGGTWLVTGTVTAVTVEGLPKWQLSFDLPRNATENLTKGVYDWSVEVSDGSSNEVTRVRNENFNYKATLVEKQT